jgi:hypothetical protein
LLRRLSSASARHPLQRHWCEKRKKGKKKSRNFGGAAAIAPSFALSPLFIAVFPDNSSANDGEDFFQATVLVKIKLTSTALRAREAKRNTVFFLRLQKHRTCCSHFANAATP